MDQTLSILFDPSSGADFIGVTTRLTFPNGSILISDQFIDGNWVAQVPEPGTLMLLGIGLLGVGSEPTESEPSLDIVYEDFLGGSSPNDASEGA